MGKAVHQIKLSATLHITECTDGWWLWDAVRGMNLSMKAKTSTDAFVEALTYYQRRLAEVERAHSSLKEKVDAFVAQFHDDED
jgi:hypothetical protein